MLVHSAEWNKQAMILKKKKSVPKYRYLQDYKIVKAVKSVFLTHCIL